jgi:hypothetical protein
MMARRFLGLIGVFICAALVACVPATQSTRPSDIGSFELDSAGIAPNGTDLRIDFGRAQPGVIETVTRLMGRAPVQVSTNTQCGAGHVTAAQWRGGLVLNFMNQTFLGWVNEDASLGVVGGFRPGQARDDMPNVRFETTSLGAEFGNGQIFGLMNADGDRVDQLWSGITCFFR